MALKPRGEQPEPQKKSERMDPTHFSSFQEILDELEAKGPKALEQSTEGIPDAILEQAHIAAKLIDELVNAHDAMVLNPDDPIVGEKFIDKMREVLNADEKITITVLSAGASALSLIKSFLGPNGMPGFPGNKK